jgi:subtilisin family serine protease
MSQRPQFRGLLGLAGLLFAILAPSGALQAAAGASPHTAAAPSRSSAPQEAGSGPADTARYIVELSDPPLIAYAGDQAGLPATAPGKARPEALDAEGRLDPQSAPAMAYAAFLSARQARFEAAVQSIAPGVRAGYHYRVALNGMSLRLDPQQAEVVRRMPDVLGLTREEAVIPLMDASLPQIKAPEAWQDPRIGGRAEAGKGVRIAVIDSGITASHPFFSPAGFQMPEGFPRASLVIGDQVLDYAAEDRARYTNAKVIAARVYVNPELVDPASQEDPRLTFTPLADGIGGFHGAHVAGTAAGSIARGAPGSTAGNLELSGVAPGAWLMAYKFSNAYTPEILKMIDDAVADGADVINNSWGTSAMNVLPSGYHPVARAFEQASAAGVVVVAAAGNAGSNGEATLGGPHQMSPSVITVANVQTGRSFAYELQALDAELPAELETHPTAYQAFDNSFGVIEKPAARIADFCNPLGLALGALGKVILEPIEGSCDIPGLPFQLPAQFGFVSKLLLAGVANAATPAPLIESIVFYAPDGEPGTTIQLLGLLDTFAPLLEQFGLNVKLPIVAVITGDQAMSLAAWADTHPSLKIRLDSTPRSVYDPALSDAANLTSSQGPVPMNARQLPQLGALKPDLSAPGTNIVSTNTDVDGQPDGYIAASGTSMSSPHVAGAAAVLIQAWPDWSPAQIKSALMVASDPVVTVAGETAPATVQGAGRLNLARAIDPGLLVLPPSFDLRLAPDAEQGVTLRLEDVRLAADSGITYRLREAPGIGAMPDQAVFDLAPEASLSIAAGGSSEVTLTTAALGLEPGVYDGHIVFEEAESATHLVRLRYRVVVPGDRRDVLLINIRRSATAGGGGIPGLPGIPGIPGLPGGGGFEDLEDYSVYWTTALDAAGLRHDVWTVADGAEAGAPPLSVLSRYDLVILAAGDGNAPLDQLLGGMTALQMYLLGGGRMLVSGHNWAHAGGQALGLQNNGAMHYLSRYFAGFELLADDVEPAGSITPERLFDLPITLASGPRSGAAANGGSVDFGRPLAGLQTLAPDGGLALPPDLGIAAPMVVDRVMPYMHSFLEVDGQGSLMTGVTEDATLETPMRADFIPWRAIFAGFGFEAVVAESGHHDRAAMLSKIHAWAMESSELSIQVTGPSSIETGQRATFIAEASAAPGVEVIGWRWDRGDGRGYVRSSDAVLASSYLRPGSITVRAEAMTAMGHTYVGESIVEVTGPARIYLPVLRLR